MRRLCLVAWLFPVAAAGAGEEPPLVPLEGLVFLRGDSAVQALDGERIDAVGDLLLRTDAWTIHADSAVIEGPPGDPDLVEVEGSPARIRYQRDADADVVRGFSRRLRFQPHAEFVELEGSARIESEDRLITSESIRYLLDTDTFSAGRGGRVRVVKIPR